MFRQTKQPFFFMSLLLLVIVSLTACAPMAMPATNSESSQVAADPTATAVPELTLEPSPEPTVATAAEQPPAADNTTSGGIRVFQIDPAQSKARFYIDELLRGQPKTVIGETSKVSGSITVDLADVSKSSVGTIQIDASDLTTDSSMRNGAIRRFVLQSNQTEYQYITFEPTTIEGLPNTAQAGDTLNFKVTGNLKIREIAKPVTFDLTLTVNADNQLSGIAKTVIIRADYDLSIPSVPSVANVAEEVPLEFEFIALAQ